LVPPDLVECTVEKVAINAVLAGCLPEYLPVVLTALEAACTDEFNIHGLLATTMPVGPVLIINGPIRRQIGMNAGINVLGQGNRANSTIGRALQLVIRNVGGGRPGGVDRATQGNPGKVSFASQGNGSTSHLTAILFEKLTGTKMVHVPYRGTTPALQDIMGNTVDMFFDNLGSSMSLHVGKKLRILAVCGPERAPLLADVPTVREAGIPDFVSVTWFALMAPKGTPEAVVAKLNAAVTEILKDPDIQAQFAKLGVQPAPMSIPETAKFIGEERVRWGDIIKSANVTVD